MSLLWDLSWAMREWCGIGKLLIGDVLKDQLSPALKDQFLTQYELTPALIMDKVYRQPFPNRFLAGFSPFIREHLDEPAIWELVTRSFLAFLPGM